MPENTDIALPGKRILLVEDDKFFAGLVGDRLSHVGCEVTTAYTAEEALSMLKEYQPDVIILDILLPGDMDGFAFLRQIKTNDKLKDLPVVILSNLGESSDVEKGMSLGAFRYIVKASIEPDEIVGYIESAINFQLK